MKNKLMKPAIFNDIHFGRKDNSFIHNTDCLNFIKWMVSEIKKDPTIDCVIFNGDWFEHRNAVNGLTIDFSIEGASLINELGLPVFWMLGNHDLYYRNKRDIYTTKMFQQFENFQIVTEITPMDNLGDGSLLVPFLFEHEYPKLLDYVGDYNVFFGHFEFKGFVITGDTVKKEHGPDHTTLKPVRRIFSGHFHKRQIKDNVIYTGSTFPMDFSDANDSERGFTTYDFKTDSVEFHDWEQGPTYSRNDLSVILESPKKFLKKNGVVLAKDDVGLDYEEAIKIREKLIKKFDLREFTIDDSFDANANLDGDSEFEDELLDKDTHTIIKEKLKLVEVESIDTDKLIKLYEEI